MPLLLLWLVLSSCCPATPCWVLVAPHANHAVPVLLLAVQAKEKAYEQERRASPAGRDIEDEAQIAATLAGT